MPKIRSIHPDFWTDSKILKLSPLDRLFYIGLWNFCDDDGVFQYDEEQLAIRILPDQPMTNGWGGVLTRLNNCCLLSRLSYKNGCYGIVLNFSKYQRVNKNWHRSTLKPHQLELFYGQPLANSGPTVGQQPVLVVGKVVVLGNDKDTNVSFVHSTAENISIEHELFNHYEKISRRKVRARVKYLPNLKARLKEFTQEQILAAWKSMATDDFLRGEGKNGGRDYFTMDYALRAKKIDEWLNKAENNLPSVSEPARFVEEIIHKADGTEIRKQILIP